MLLPLTARNPGSIRPTPPSTWAFRSRGAGIRLPCPAQERTAARWAACWRGTISIIRWRYVGWSAGGACEFFEDESQGCVSWLPRSCRLLVPGVDRFWPEKLLRCCQALISVLLPRTLQKDCHRATNADRFGVSNFPLPLFEPGPKSCATVVTSSRPDSAGRVRGRDGRTRSGAAGRISIGAVRNGPARRDERHAVATFRAPRQVDPVRGF